MEVGSCFLATIVCGRHHRSIRSMRTPFIFTTAVVRHSRQLDTPPIQSQELSMLMRGAQWRRMEAKEGKRALLHSSTHVGLFYLGYRTPLIGPGFINSSRRSTTIGHAHLCQVRGHQDAANHCRQKIIHARCFQESKPRFTLTFNRKPRINARALKSIIFHAPSSLNQTKRASFKSISSLVEADVSGGAQINTQERATTRKMSTTSFTTAEHRIGTAVA